MKENIARLDRSIISKSVGSFPTPKGGWKCIRDLSKQAIQNVGGVYAFMLPRERFASARTIRLDGPNRRELGFRFSADDFPLLPNSRNRLVAYVGRTTKLAQRLGGHLSASEEATTNQVVRGLVKSHKAMDFTEAANTVLREAEFVYLVLDGARHTANRDIIEASLIGLYAPPYNVKSEH